MCTIRRPRCASGPSSAISSNGRITAWGRSAGWTSFVLYDKALMQQQNATVCVGHPSVILSTDNAERTYEQMKADDVAVGSLQQMPYGTMFTFQDPEGNSYLVRQEP